MVSELTHPAAPDPTAPVLRLVEWIASDPESGVLRVRGDFPDSTRSYPEAPVLVLRDESGSLTRRPPLNEDRPGADGWRAAYLIAGALLGGAVERWLEWSEGSRLALPDVDVSTGDGRTPAPPPERGAEVFDRAVLAERRAQRAETAQREQARTAEAAVAALGALERRVEELTRERDALAHGHRQAEPPGAASAEVRVLTPVPEPADPGPDLAGELEAARAAQRAAERSERRHHESLDQALSTLGRLRLQAAETRLRLRTHMASASADAVRLAVLESERRGLRARLRDVRGELEGLRARFAGEQARSQRLTAALETARADVRRLEADREELRALLDGERAARTRAEQLRTAPSADVGAAEAEAASERMRLAEQSEALRRRLADLGQQLRAERSARASLAVQLRVSRASEGAARAEAAARAAAQSRLRREQAEALEQASAARSELAGLRAAAQAPARAEAGEELSPPDPRLAALEADLGDTRAALEAARARLSAVASAAVSEPEAAIAERGEGVPHEAADAPHPPRPTLSPAIAAELRRRLGAFQQAAARGDADGSPSPARADAESSAAPAGVAARLDAAAASLRAAVRSPPLAEAPATAAVPPPPAAAAPPQAGAVALAPNGAAALPTAAPASPTDRPTPSRALTVLPPSAVVIAGSSAAPDSGQAARRVPSLRVALVRLAAEDPFSAARLLAALLPAQGAFLREDVDYDLTIRELGTFSVTVAGGRTSVSALSRPRSRREAPMHLTAHALTLAELLAGRPRRVGRVLSPVRLRGSRRGLETLAVLAETGPTLAEVARAGAVLDPALLARALPYVVGAADTDGYSFTVAHELPGETPGTWYVTADGRRGLRVGTRAPDGGADARVTLSRATFDRILRAEPPDRERKPWVRGDFTAVEALRRWIDAARG